MLARPRVAVHVAPRVPVLPVYDTPRYRCCALYAGEHVDYHGYSVLPCALEHDVVIAVGGVAASAEVRVGNTNAKYPGGAFPADPAAPVDRSGPLQWWQYVQCGYKGAFDAAPAGKGAPSRGIALVVDGKVPAAAGVSSSSALVVAATLAVSRANGIHVRTPRDATRDGGGGSSCVL